jgi:hypothetical protein
VGKAFLAMQFGSDRGDTGLVADIADLALMTLAV